METVELGQIIEGDANRDAIHVAIAPVIAGESLRPGQGIAFESGSTERVRAYGTTIGIVDPFLRESVKEGQRFFMVLYPGTITSLRHEWTHPAFPQSKVENDERSRSERWLMVYAEKMNCYDEPEKAFHNLLHGLRTGELFAHGSDLHGLYELDDADHLKKHAERYLGITIDWGRFEFTCSC